MIARAAFALAISLTPMPGLAETLQGDWITTTGPLSDEDFYRLASCGAPPGQFCRATPLRWTKADLTLRISSAEPGVPGWFPDALVPPVERAIAQINGSGAAIHLALTDAKIADITIRPTTLREGTLLAERPGYSGPGRMGIGYTTVWSNSDGTITDAVILISTDITEADVPSVMLEEVTQSLGFLYDIDNPAYEGVSILSETSNATVTIAGQDAMILQRHYPPTP